MFWFIMCGLAVFLLLILYGFCQNFFLCTEFYTVKAADVTKEKRIVLLADLHGNHFGKGNDKLLTEIVWAEPDCVCIAGDMTVKNGKGAREMIAFLGKLAKKYPVYYAPGNHEIRMPHYGRYRRKLEEKGVVYLENEWVISDGYAIGGLDLPEYWYHKCWDKRELDKKTLSEIIKPPGQISGGEKLFSILLAHNPEYFRTYADFGASLVLSGHIHGGIARLPGFGGVISPSLRLFPAYDAGLFQEGESYMVLSRGLGLHHIRLRFFNRPELSIIDISRKNG